MTKTPEWYDGYQQALAEAANVIRQYPYHAGDGWGEIQDVCDDIRDLLAKKLSGSVAQMVTQRPAKTPSPQGVVGSTPTTTATITTLRGCNVVLTGKLRTMSRVDAIYRNDRAGVKTQSAVNSKTDFLVVADARGSVKWNAAVAKGVPVLSENDWYEFTK